MKIGIRGEIPEAARRLIDQLNGAGVLPVTVHEVQGYQEGVIWRRVSRRACAQSLRRENLPSS